MPDTPTNEELLSALARVFGEAPIAADVGRRYPPISDLKRAYDAVLARMVEPEEGSTQAYQGQLARASSTPLGQAIVERIGWEKRLGVKRFSAVLVFPNGPPDLSVSVVWDAIPVRLVMDPPAATSLETAPQEPLS